MARLSREARYGHIQACLAEQRKLRAEGFHVRLPILRDLRDEELVATRAELTRKGNDARKAKAQAELDADVNRKRGIMPANRHKAPTPNRDPLLERVREIRADYRKQAMEAVAQGLGGLNLLGESEAAE